MNNHAPVGPLVKSLDLPLENDEKRGWAIHNVFKGSSASMKRFGCHLSVLYPGKIPHLPHAHEEEELIVLLSGRADIMDLDHMHNIRTRRIAPGWLVYHPANQRHTIQSIGPGPASYIVFKWKGRRGGEEDNALRESLFQMPEYRAEPGSEVAYALIFDSPTLYLRKLRCHATTLQPGAGYEPHTDQYDVIILTLRGEIETLGEPAGPYSIIFYPAGEPHGIKNTGSVMARYLVIEFHGGKLRRKWYSLIRTALHVFRRLIRPSARPIPFRTR